MQISKCNHKCNAMFTFIFTFLSFKSEIINCFYISEQPKLNYEHPSLCDAMLVICSK